MDASGLKKTTSKINKASDANINRTTINSPILEVSGEDSANTIEKVTQMPVSHEMSCAD